MWNPPTHRVHDRSTLKNMIAKALEAGINAVMNTHVYKFAGEIKSQKQGGAIGLELTGEIAGVFMTWWDREMKKKLREENVKIVMYKRYVDDINLIVETKEETKEKEIWNHIKEIGNQIHESIQLEADYPSNHDDHKVPILDVKVWVENNSQVMHEYYSKSVSSKAVIDVQSAMPLKNKRTILTQDLLRVIMRCSPNLPWNTKKTHIEEYALRLQFSGYGEKFIKEIVRSAINAFEKIKRRVKKGERPFYRTKEWRKKERAKEKRKKKNTWYMENKRESQNGSSGDFKSVLFVQPTKNSVLKKKYEEVIEASKCNIRVIERAGKSISQKLQKSYPFSKVKCASNDCFVCISEGKGNCMKENINYEIECIREGCEYVYFGESCRNAYSRGREHLKGITRKDGDSVFVEHVMNEHSGDFMNDPCSGFRMNVKQTHKTALERQITEAIKIDTATRKTMNRRTGYRVNNVLGLRCSLTPNDSTYVEL